MVPAQCHRRAGYSGFVPGESESGADKVYWLSSYANVAVGDIDQDGLVEIVAVVPCSGGAVGSAARLTLAKAADAVSTVV